MGKILLTQSLVDAAIMLILANLDEFTDSTKEQALQVVHDLKNDICGQQTIDIEPDCV